MDLDWEGNEIQTFWSEDDKNRLVLLHESGYTWPKVALMLGNSRTVAACTKMYSRIVTERSEVGRYGSGTEDEDDEDDDGDSGGGASAGAGPGPGPGVGAVAGAKGTRVRWTKQQHNKLIAVCKDMDMNPTLKHHITVWRQVATRVGGNHNARACKHLWTKITKQKALSKDGRGWTPEEDAEIMLQYKDFGARWKYYTIGNRSRQSIRGRFNRLKKGKTIKLINGAAPPPPPPHDSDSDSGGSDES